MHWRARNIRRFTLLCTLGALFAVVDWGQSAYGWPAAMIESRHENCMSCHDAAGKWTDTSKVIIDIVDPKTNESFRQPDGAFEVTVKRGEERRIKSVFGVRPEYKYPPDVVGWLYASAVALETAHESDIKFAPGWQVNRPFCGKRLIETVKGYPGEKLAAITMTIRPLDDAEDATVSLHVMLKSSARGLAGDYFEREVRLRVTD